MTFFNIILKGLIKFKIVFLILAAIFSAAIIFVFYKPAPRVCFKNICLNVEIADDAFERAQGLMNRVSLGKSNGMLFVFQKDDYWGFWMKNTLIPLDIIWLDSNGYVVDIVESARPYLGDNPPILMPAYRSRFVLEANAGFVGNSRIKIGDRAKFNYKKQ